MAFRTIDQWQVERHFVPGFDARWLPSLPSNLRYPNQLQKMSSGGFALALHGTFFYFLLNSLLAQNIDESIVPQKSESPSITMIELGDIVDEDTAEPEVADAKESEQLAATVPSKLDISAQSKLPPEWSQSRIAVPRVVAEPAQQEVAAVAVAGKTKGGGGVYDPFAGAAPNRKTGLEESGRKPEVKPTLAGRISGFFGFEDEAETQEPDGFEQWVAGLRKRLPRAKGSVELSVTIGTDGKVKAGKIIGGSASPQVKFFVRNAVIGKVFPNLSAGNVGMQLPMIILG